HENEERTTKNSNSVTKPSTESDQAYRKGLAERKGNQQIGLSPFAPLSFCWLTLAARSGYRFKSLASVRQYSQASASVARAMSLQMSLA
ncbi:MAG: hypothetical protein K2Y23_24240, partial [Cyanobacteria bacterium]|nr:hypothetical protein [Cyanobacteriota bacterium]